MSSKVRTIIMPLVLGAIIITLAILEYKDLFYSFDQNITRFIVDNRGSKGNAIYYLSRILTEFGNYFVYAALFLSLGFYFKWDYRVWYLLSIGIITILLNYGIKLIVSRDRPAVVYRWMKETSASFPSSHSAVSTNIKPVVEYNRNTIYQIIDILLDFLKEEHNCVECCQYVFNYFNLRITYNKYMLILSTIRSYLSYLSNSKRIRNYFKDNRLLFINDNKKEEN